MSRLKGADAGVTAVGAASRYVVSPRSGEGVYHTTGTSDHSVINQALADASSGTSKPGEVILMEGVYNCGGPVVLPDNPNVTLRGAGKDRVQLKFSNLTATTLVGRSSVATTRYKFHLSGFTIDNQSKANAGAIGLALDNLSNASVDDLVLTNCAEAIRLINGSYFNVFDDVDIEECVTGVHLAGTVANNENRFLFMKAAKALGGVGVDYPVVVDAGGGNDNHWIACSFEDFITGVHLADIGNHFLTCRIECNDRLDYAQHVLLDSTAHNNTFTEPYLSGNKWVDRATSIVDNGSGNAFIVFSTFKDQFMRAERNLITADDFIYMRRSGSGDAKSVYVADDTYTPSGSPISYKAKHVRALGKYISGELNGVEKYSVDSNGLAISGAVDNMWSPNLYGFKSWAYDPVAAVNNSVPTGGLLQLVAVRINRATPITHVYLWCGTAGVGTTNAYAAIYSSAGALLEQSDDQSANMGTTGLKTFTFATPATVSAGYIYVAFWLTATTTVPAISRAAGSTIANALLGTAYRHATADAGLTTTAPSSLGAKTSGSVAYWAAVD